MKITRRITALALALLMLTALAACGSSSDDPASPSEEVIGDVASSAAPSESPEASEEPEETPEPTPTPTPTPTPAPTAQPAVTPEPTPSAQPSEKPAEPSEAPVSPSAQPSEEPSSGSVDLSAFFSTVTSTYEFASLSDLDSTMLDNFYPGLTAVSTLQLIAKMPMISASGHEIILIQCENSDDVATVQSILEARKQAQVDGGAWYPETTALWEKAEICVSGNYLMLVSHENAADIAASFYALFA
ncbi:MAG: DUF4358 domain-containing protein [Candidatus Scatomorpha sp.]|jgi:hypothetical protein